MAAGRGAGSGRWSGALAMQQQALFQLVVGGVLVAALCVGAVYVYVGGLGSRNVRSVAPVLEAFMRAGQAGDVLAAHSLYSAQGLRDVAAQDVAAVVARRDLFDGYDGLTVSSLTFGPGDAPAVDETAVVVAALRFASGPAGRIDARLDLEPDGWRLRAIQVTRPGP